MPRRRTVHLLARPPRANKQQCSLSANSVIGQQEWHHPTVVMGNPGLFQELPDIPSLLSGGGGDGEQVCSADGAVGRLDATTYLALDDGLPQRPSAPLLVGSIPQSPGRYTTHQPPSGASGRRAPCWPMAFDRHAQRPAPPPAGGGLQRPAGTAGFFVATPPVDWSILVEEPLLKQPAHNTSVFMRQT